MRWGCERVREGAGVWLIGCGSCCVLCEPGFSPLSLSPHCSYRILDIVTFNQCRLTRSLHKPNETEKGLGYCKDIRYLLKGWTRKITCVHRVGNNEEENNVTSSLNEISTDQLKPLKFCCDMPLFLIYCVFLYMIQAGIDKIHYCCMDVVGWKRQEVGLKRACRLSVVGLCGF